MTIFTYKDQSFTSFRQRNGEFVKKTHSFKVTVDTQSKTVVFTFDKDFKENYVPVTVFANFIEQFNVHLKSNKGCIHIWNEHLSSGNDLLEHSCPQKMDDIVSTDKNLKYSPNCKADLQKTISAKNNAVQSVQEAIQDSLNEFDKKDSLSKTSIQKLFSAWNNLNEINQTTNSIKINEFGASKDISLSFPGENFKYNLKFALANG